MFRHRTLTVGGTFWPIHKGHRALLDAAFNDGLEVFIGLTSDQLVRRRKSQEGIPGYGARKKSLLNYLSERGYEDRAHVFRIEDEFGFAADFPNLQAIAVSKETLRTAERINKRREARSMKPLDIVKIDMVKADDGSPITSSRIRSGEIDKEGNLIKGR